MGTALRSKADRFVREARPATLPSFVAGRLRAVLARAQRASPGSPPSQAPSSAREPGGETAVLCAIAKDEERYIDEWIAYHVKLGFERVYVYDNSATHSLRGLSERHDGRVHVTHFPGRRRHIPAYQHFVYTRRQHTWVAFVDVDEFIVLKRHPDILSLLREHCPRGALSLNWYMFGSSGETEYRDAPVLERFQWRAAAINQHVKTLCRIADIAGIASSHFPRVLPGATQHDTRGKPFEGPFNPGGPADVAVIHHYFTKSQEEFDDKVLRGRSDAPGLRALEDFARSDVNEVKDSSAWDFFQCAR